MLFAFRATASTALVLLILVLSTPVRSQSPFLLKDSATSYRIDDSVEVYIDDEGSLSVSDIIKPEFQKHFYQSGGNLTFGYLKSTIWLKVVTKSVGPQEWLLEIPAPFLEYVDFYQRHDSTWRHSQAGYYRPQSVKNVPHTGHVLPLEFSAENTSTVFIRIAGQSPKTFPVFIVEKEKFNDKVRWEDLGYGVFFGILIVMFFYNLFIYLTLRQTNYLLYICTIIWTFFIFGSATGYAGKFLWPEHPMMNYYAGRLSLGVHILFLSIFTIRFLEVRKYSRGMYYALLLLIPLSFIAIVLVATNTLSSAGNNLISLATVMFMVTGIICRAKGNKTANYFIAAWSIYFFGGLLLTLRNSGTLAFNFWTTHFVEIGAALETIIIAFALGDRYRKLRIEKEEAQLLALRFQQEATVKLEVKVKERTEQLSRTNDELQSMLTTNKQQTQTIQDKNAELDAFFYRISHDLKGPISSLLGLSYLAKMDVKDKPALEYLEKQHHQLERLNSIVTGLINLVMLNHSEPLREKIDFGKMVEDCITSFNAHPNFHTITFKRDICPRVELQSEWSLLNAILQNLIENAIKYSNKQTPFVFIRIHQESNTVILEVEDNGQGIPREHQSKIFEMFYRASQNTNGTGLGLYILKRSLDRLKGTIEIKSDVGIGSTFTVKIPA